jgi:hypothetical protein
MTKRDIVEGLRVAVNKGEPLRKAMMSFFNAGYDRKEIEEAAREIIAQPGAPGQPIQPEPLPQPPVQPEPLPSPPIQQPMPLKPPQFRPLSQYGFQGVQRVSDYRQKPKPASLVITIMLVFFLLFLVGVLAAVFFFKEEITRFLNRGFLSFLY